MERGDVYLVRIALPNRTDPNGPAVNRDKYVIILRGGSAFASETDVPVVVASSDRSAGALRNFEVRLDTDVGFRHATIVDCRWPMTLTKLQIQGGQYKFRLSKQSMKAVSIGLFDGLQMYRPKAPPTSAS